MRLSVAIPNYNGGEKLKNAVESLERIRIPVEDYEIIVVDNKSTDNSIDLLLALGKRFPNLKVFVNESNIGRIQNWNACLKYCSGKFVMFLFTNDEVNINNNVHEVLDLLDADSDLSIAVSGFVAIEGNKKITRRAYSNHMTRCPSREFIISCLNRRVLPFGVIQSLVYRLEDIRSKNIRFSEENPIVADQIFTFIQAMQRQTILFDPCPQINWVLTSERFHAKASRDDEAIQQDKAIDIVSHELGLRLNQDMLAHYYSIASILRKDDPIWRKLIQLTGILLCKRKFDAIILHAILDKLLHPNKEIHETLIKAILFHIGPK